MRNRNVILYTSVTGEILSHLLDRVAFIAESTELILCRTPESLTESLYNHGLEEPVVILFLKNEKEMSAILCLASLLQRFDIILMLWEMDSANQKRAGPLRPRLILDVDDHAEKIELLIKGVMAKGTVKQEAGKRVS